MNNAHSLPLAALGIKINHSPERLLNDGNWVNGCSCGYMSPIHLSHTSHTSQHISRENMIEFCGAHPNVVNALNPEVLEAVNQVGFTSYSTEVQEVESKLEASRLVEEALIPVLEKVAAKPELVTFADEPGFVHSYILDEPLANILTEVIGLTRKLVKPQDVPDLETGGFVIPFDLQIRMLEEAAYGKEWVTTMQAGVSTGYTDLAHRIVNTNRAHRYVGVPI